jgi:CubicO group peptidase (beta-lactamase class C family)
LTAEGRSGSSAIESGGVAAALQSEIDLGTFPSASWKTNSEEAALGNAVAVPLRIPATADTIYDCASLTKPLITTTLILQAVAEGRISLEQEFQGYTFRELLTHTSGLRAWMPLYTRGDYLRAILEEGPEIACGSNVIYSDLNFVLLWYAIGEIYGDYVTAARERILRPLGIESEAMFNAPASLRPRIAATEWGQRWEAKLGNIAAPRDGLIWGETHDGNSHFAGGTAGNAGLFATARAVYRLGQSWLRAELLPQSLINEATRNLTPQMSDGRGLGWQKPTGSDATRMLSDRAYGHTGFTGTSLWIDGDAIYVLLTNRVHPCAAPVAMQRVRGEFHLRVMPA